MAARPRWPAAVADPGPGFPWPWSVYRWIWARGWALWKALNTLSGERHGGDSGQAAARRFGWRYSPRQIIGRVIADHARPVVR